MAQSPRSANAPGSRATAASPAGPSFTAILASLLLGGFALVLAVRHAWAPSTRLGAYAPPSPPPHDAARTAPFPLAPLNFAAEAPRACAGGAPVHLLRISAGLPPNEVYVSNVEVLPDTYVFGVRNLVRHWRTLRGEDGWKAVWHFEAARCTPQADSELDIFMAEDAALADVDTPGAPARVLLVAQSPWDDSLGHFIWEAAVAFRYFWPLAHVYPTLQIVLRPFGDLTLKRRMLADFAIPESRVLWRDLVRDNGAWGFNTVVEEDFGHDNLVLFPPNLTPIAGTVEEWRRQIPALAAHLIAGAGLPPRESCASTPRGLLLAPRNSAKAKPGDPVLIADVFSSVVRDAVARHGGHVVDSSKFTSFFEQAKLYGSARVIIMTYGSAFDFNTMFMRGATVICTNSVGQDWHHLPSLNDHLVPFLRYNRVFWTNNESEIVDLLDRAMRAPPLPCPMRVSWLRRHFPLPTKDGDTVIMPPLSAYADKDP
jgi:hypothetical protein